MAGNSCCNCEEKCQCDHYDIAWIKRKFRTRLSWSVGMYILASLHCLFSWLNFFQLTSKQLHRGLVIGPPTFVMYVMLLMFTIIGSVLYVLESINTFSVFIHDHGLPYLSLIYELLITLPLVHIPQAAINYFVSRCRRQYTTTFQTLCGTFSIAFVFIRLVWYAHLEGKQLRMDDKKKLKNGLMMLVCALYAMSMAFYVGNWKKGPAVMLKDEHVKNMSIMLLKAPFLENECVESYDVDHILDLQGWSRSQPELVPSVLKIKNAPSPPGILIPFACKHNATFVPYECNSETKQLIFRFQYSPHVPNSPFGEVIYNFARLYKDGRCQDTEADLAESWRLWYFYAKKQNQRDGPHVLLTSHWPGTCTVPKLGYNESLAVCPWYSSVGVHKYSSLVVKQAKDY